MQKITPFLWFNDAAETAANYYVSVFADAKILNVARYGESGPGPAGTAMTVAFRIMGQDFVALNGGPIYTFTPAISFVINCETQEEVDHYWEKLSAGGEEVQCGWLKDQFGVSWQVVPTILSQLMSDPDPIKSQRVMKAMLQMKKINIAELQNAYDAQ